LKRSRRVSKYGKERGYRQKYLPIAMGLGALTMVALLAAEYAKNGTMFREEGVVSDALEGEGFTRMLGEGGGGDLRWLVNKNDYSDRSLELEESVDADEDTPHLTGVINGTCMGLHGLPAATGGVDGANVAVSIICILWAFVGLAIVCDEFFQPSLEAISEVSGAHIMYSYTFMRILCLCVCARAHASLSVIMTTPQGS
jgi:hypothetical protein